VVDPDRSQIVNGMSRCARFRTAAFDGEECRWLAPEHARPQYFADFGRFDDISIPQCKQRFIQSSPPLELATVQFTGSPINHSANLGLKTRWHSGPLSAIPSSWWK